jgi:Rrf2 family iron-sulfur cluster assembly transcriptional regulator
MKIGTKGRYAVMAMIDMVKFGREGTPIALSEIAARQEIALSYLEQLFCKLRRAGLVTSARGVFGGYSLSRPPYAISISEIVAAADEPVRFTRCHSNKEKGCMANSTQCIAHHLWDALGNQMISYLEQISLQDVLDKKLHKFPLEKVACG